VNELYVVFTTEIKRRIRSRPFIIATLFGALGMAFFVEAPALFSRVFVGESDAIVLAGPASLRGPAAELLNKDFRVKASVDRLPATVTNAYLDAHGKAAAAIALSSKNGRLHVDVYARDLAAFNEVEFRGLAPLNFQLATGLPLERTREYVRVDRTLHGIDSKFADSRAAALGHAVALGFVFVLYLAILMSAQAVMASVAEEKTSRIAELLVATISPINLLTGKTLAAATLALLQVVIWVGTAAVLFPSAAASSVTPGSAVPVSSLVVQPEELIAFVAFFIVGYLQYATIYAAGASLISRTEDLGSVSGPIVLPIVAAFLIAQLASASPNAPVVVAFSFVPFISPFVMFTRMAVSTVPAWQIGAALAINAVAAGLAFYAAGKVYRVGMLLYGKLPSLRQIAAVLRE
jgi:ABC-type Na+ efflux pump permease subunit